MEVLQTNLYSTLSKSFRKKKQNFLFFSCDGSASDYKPPCYPILPVRNNQPPCIRFVRSSAMCQQDGFPMEREQINAITGVIDGNNVYGSDEETTRSLRDLESK